jgi:hypothetical protein
VRKILCASAAFMLLTGAAMAQGSTDAGGSQSSQGSQGSGKPGGGASANTGGQRSTPATRPGDVPSTHNPAGGKPNRTGAKNGDVSGKGTGAPSKP